MNTAVNMQSFNDAQTLGRSSLKVISEVTDGLENARHLMKAAIMACDSIEDLESRNGFVALLAEIDSKVLEASSYLREGAL